ncbi:MAG: hypothetical protein ABSA13_08670 [Beijerinckiaceae bacterium]|jgi:hypothetical protein
MSRLKQKASGSAVTLFDVYYEDGSRSSNRKVSSALLGGLDGDEPARQAIEEQDQVIAAKASRSAAVIKKLIRSN